MRREDTSGPTHGSAGRGNRALDPWLPALALALGLAAVGVSIARPRWPEATLLAATLVAAPALHWLARARRVHSRRWARVLWVAGVNVVLTALLLEVGVRSYLATDRAPAWLLPAPDTAAYRLDPAGSYLGTRPNSQGFYDTEFSPVRRPGVTRVVAIGDSYSVGMVPYAENYLTRVDEQLGSDVEIFNLGVVHTALRQYLQILRDEGLRLHPDAVLIGIYLGNDVKEDPQAPSWLDSRAFVVARRVATYLREGIAEGVTRPTSSMYRFDADGKRVERPLMSPAKYDSREWKHLRRIFRPPPSGHMRRGWRDTEAALRSIVALCREHGLPVFATLAPDEIQVSDHLLEQTLAAHHARAGDFDLDYVSRRFREQLERLGVPFLDLTPALRRAEPGGATYHLRAVHWNRRGNAVVANALAPWLVRQLRQARSQPD